jgi:hypothetical protein
MTDHVQPNWAGAPDWAKFWAVDSDGGAYWYRSQPTYDRKYEGWVRLLGDEPDAIFDHCWPPKGFDDWDIDWEQTLRSRS